MKVTHKIFFYTLITTLFVVLATYSIRSVSLGRTAKKAEPTVVKVTVSEAKMENIPDIIPAVGHLKALKQVDLSFNAAGHMVKINYKSGQRVQKGKIVAELDDAASQAQLQSLQADLALKQSTYARILELKKFGGVSAEVVDQKKADLVAAQAAVKQQQVTIAQTKLVAPFTGVLGDFQLDIGAYVSVGLNIVSLVQEAPLKVRYSIPAQYKAQVEIGQSVTIKNNSYPDKTFSGVVSFISPTVSKDSGTLTVEARIPNEDFLLSPGMFVDVTQFINPDRQLLMIPETALLTDADGQYVYRITEGKPEKVYVKPGLVKEGRVAIPGKLEARDEIVIAGQQKIQPGDVIEVEKVTIMKDTQEDNNTQKDVPKTPVKIN